MKKFTLKERFFYWLDQKTLQGTAGMIQLLSICTGCIVVLISTVIFAFSLNEEGGILAIIWDSFAAILNTGIVTSDGGNVGYIIIMSLAGMTGVLFTSILIGIFSTGIEERVNSLKHGNNLIIENNHEVIIGFKEGHYELLRQECLAADGKKKTIVLISDLERDKMEELVDDNIDEFKNVNIICRSIDARDPNQLKNVSISTASKIFIDESDAKTTQILLAINGLLEKEPNNNVQIFACSSDKSNSLALELASNGKATIFNIESIVSRIIAYSCIQAGTAVVFNNIFSFEDDNVFIEYNQKLVGLTFEEVSLSLNNAAPLGIYRKGQIMINPNKEEVVLEEDGVIVLSKDIKKLVILDQMMAVNVDQLEPPETFNGKHRGVAIIGYNQRLEKIVEELHESSYPITLVAESESIIREKYSTSIFNKMLVKDVDVKDDDELASLLLKCPHIVLLKNDELTEEDSDEEMTLLLLRIRRLCKKLYIDYNITVEMCSEASKALAIANDTTDFVLTSDMSAMVVSQCANDPRLNAFFKELLDDKGNEIYLRRSSFFLPSGRYTTAQLRKVALDNDATFVGLIQKDADSTKYLINPPLNQTLDVDTQDNFIILAEN